MKKVIILLIFLIEYLTAGYSYVTDDNEYYIIVYTQDCLYGEKYRVQVSTVDEEPDKKGMIEMMMWFVCTPEDKAYAAFERTKLNEEGCTEDYCPIENP